MPIKQIPQFANIGSVVPYENVYNNDLKPAVQADRVTVRIPSQISQITEASNQMIFDIPNSSVMDFRKGCLSFKLALTGSGGGGTYIRASNGVHTGIQRIRILFDSEVIEDIDQYGIIASLLANTGDPDFQNSMGYVMAGFGSQARRQFLGDTNFVGNASGTQVYSIPLLLGSLRKPLPLNMITSRLRIEIYWAPANRWLESDYTTNSYSITDIALYADQVNFGSEYLENLKENFASSGHLTIPFISYEAFINSVTNANQSTLQIPAKKRSLKGIMSVLRTSATTSSLAQNDKFEVYNNLNIGINVRSYQVKVNNVFYPQTAVDTSSVLNGPADAAGNSLGYYNMLRLLRNWDFYRPYSLNSALAQNYYIDRFIMAINLAPHQSALMSGLDTATNFSTILFNLDLAALPASQEMTTFTIYDAVMSVDAKTGRVRKYD